jgi:tRNA (guanine37-N1)-methyltransferase
MTLHLGVISIFPEMFDGLSHGIVGKAFQKQLSKLSCWNLRDWAVSAYGQVDDRPYGGGPGMVMMYEPLHRAIIHARQSMPKGSKTIYLSPQGQRVTQQKLQDIVNRQQSCIFIAGRYEGIDERLFLNDIDEEWSLGDFVISGGEIAAMAFIDAIVRLIPGALNDERSCIEDSFVNGILDYPHFTRPAEIDGNMVPGVLLSGSHQAIERWRRAQALGKTWLKRPDLLENLVLSPEDEQLLAEFKKQHGLQLQPAPHSRSKV